MPWNIHKKLLLTGLNAAPAFEAFPAEPAGDPDWDPAAERDRDLSAVYPSYKKVIYVAVGLAVLLHLLLFALWSRAGISAAVSASTPSIMTFNFSFEKAEPLPVAAPETPFIAPKPARASAVKPPLKPALSTIAPHQQEAEPETGQQSLPASESVAVPGNTLVMAADAAAENRAAGPVGETTALISDSANGTSSAPTVFQTGYHPGSGEATQTPLIKADPNYAVNPPPEYPALARRRGYEGLVFLEVLVDRKGKVTDLKIAQSSGFAILDQSALQAVKHWLFKPAKRGSEPIEDRVKVPIRFQLQ